MEEWGCSMEGEGEKLEEQQRDIERGRQDRNMEVRRTKENVIIRREYPSQGERRKPVR